MTTSPDKLGEWKGGTQALKGEKNWVGLKSKPTRTADRKNTPSRISSDDYEKSVDFYHGKKRDPRYTERTAVPAPTDNIDTCLVCDTEVPPGPDFCSAECEEKAKNEPKEGQ
jgi:hypothetical protein